MLAGQKCFLILSSVLRYNTLGQLTCLVCEVQVKSEILWSTHLQSRKHRESVATLKAKKATPTAVGPAPSSQPEPTRGKGVKGAVDKGKEKAGTSVVKRKHSDVSIKI